MSSGSTRSGFGGLERGRSYTTRVISREIATVAVEATVSQLADSASHFLFDGVIQALRFQLAQREAGGLEMLRVAAIPKQNRLT
jgi:hypothetical protein